MLRQDHLTCSYTPHHFITVCLLSSVCLFSHHLTSPNSHSVFVVVETSQLRSAHYYLYTSGGWPECCSFDDVADDTSTACPETQPPCTLGVNYCTYAPNYDCYAEGWPTCCLSNATCPTTPDGCDTTIVDGSSFCTVAPDYSCYINGWPICCSLEDIDCPTTEPECEVNFVEGATTVLGDVLPANNNTDDGGGDGTETSLPTSSPTSLLGSSYCTWAPDYECYT
jgi:hypothetical protein